MKIRREQSPRPDAGQVKAKAPAEKPDPAKPPAPARKAAPPSRKKAKPRRLLSRFGLLTLGLLAGSGLCLFALAQWMILPDRKVGSFSALPAYNVVGQQADRADFWAIAQYHDATPKDQSPSTPLFAVEALSQLDDLFPLEQLMYSRAPGSLTAPETTVKPAWSHTNTFQMLTCIFWDDISAVYSTHTGQEFPGQIDLSLGRSATDEQQPFCFTLLFLPDETPDEQAFEAAYDSVVDDLQQLCAGQMNTFHTLEDLLANLDPAPFQENYTFSPLQAQNLTGLAGRMGSLLLELYQSGSFSYDLADPAQADALLQQYFRERGCTLQVLRLEECYLVLISTELDNGTATLGLYYSPVLKTWCGIGLQLL